MSKNEERAVILSEWLNENLKRTGIRQKELAAQIGISEAAVSQYKKGKVYTCDNDILSAMAALFETPVPRLAKPSDISENYLRAISPLSGELVRVPVFDCASAGPGAYADECAVRYRMAEVPNPLEKENYFFVNVSGDSMSPLIPDGSMVLVHKQDFIEDNKIAIVLIDGEEALVKRVHYTKGMVELISVNEDYRPRIFKDESIASLRILGKVVECVTRID